MHSLESIHNRDNDAVRREFQMALEDGDMERANAIDAANPDLELWTRKNEEAYYHSLRQIQYKNWRGETR